MLNSIDSIIAMYRWMIYSDYPSKQAKSHYPNAKYQLIGDDDDNDEDK